MILSSHDSAASHLTTASHLAPGRGADRFVERSRSVKNPDLLSIVRSHHRSPRPLKESKGRTHRSEMQA